MRQTLVRHLGEADGTNGYTERVGPHGDRSNSSVSVDGGAQGFTA